MQPPAVGQVVTAESFARGAVVKGETVGGQGADDLGPLAMGLGFDLDLRRRTINDVEEDLAGRRGIPGRELFDAAPSRRST